jgi:hypothetical protein
LGIEKGGKSKGRVFGDPEREKTVIEDMKGEKGLKMKKRERS